MQYWDFWALAIGCTSKLFPIHRKILGFLNVTLTGLLSFSQFMIKMENWVFWKQAWAVLLNFCQFTKELGNWDFWSPPYTLLPSLKPSSYRKKMRWGQGWQINKEFRWKKIWFHAFRSSQFYSTFNVFVLALVCRTIYILELFNILLSESWLTKNCRTIKISNRWDQQSFMNFVLCTWSKEVLLLTIFLRFWKAWGSFWYLKISCEG